MNTDVTRMNADKNKVTPSKTHCYSALSRARAFVFVLSAFIRLHLRLSAFLF